MTIDQITRQAEDTMRKSVEFLKQEFRGIRTGRASPGLVDSIRVDVESYGSSMALKELGSVAVTDGNVIVIKPFDPGTLRDIQRAIEKSDLGINPQNDGKMIRLPVPPLSTDRRNQLVQRVKQLAEQQKVAVRNARRDGNKLLETEQKAKTITEDQMKQAQEKVQKFTDDYIKQVDALTEEKGKEIMTV